MCGIAGFWSKTTRLQDGQEILAKMGAALHHRGPDGGGQWLPEATEPGLAHRRLAIIDLSPAGQQPMLSGSGRFVVTYNGEIYNHEQLRGQISAASESGVAWRGRSDTETLLASIEAWGLKNALPRLIGMFAFALWDKRDRKLHLVRDRLGEKPLYYGFQQQHFVFASELKALRSHPDFNSAVDHTALNLFMQQGYIPGPRSIFRDIFKLEPGSWLTLSEQDLIKRSLPQAEKYWSLPVAEAAQNWPSEIELVDQVESQLIETVRMQQISDVPLGTFLSGGSDSSLIAALMQSASSKPIKTFTIGFHEQGFDEAGKARSIAHHLGSEHHETYVSPQEALTTIDELPEVYCEPFADSSQIPALLLSKMTRSEVTVALSGDGGDELFWGYRRYRKTQKLWRAIQRLPQPLRQIICAVSACAPSFFWNALTALDKKANSTFTGQNSFGYKLAKLQDMLRNPDPRQIYSVQFRHWNDPDQRLLTGELRGDECPPEAEDGQLHTLAQILMTMDLRSYLPDDILTKVDRAAMSCGLETRIPLLDHRLVEFAWGLPFEFKQRGATNKWILRQVLARHLPSELTKAPKRGFSVPIAQWLRGPLKPWASELLDPVRIQSEGFFHSDAIQSKWHQHLSGTYNWSSCLWDVLMFQAWHAYYKPTH